MDNNYVILVSEPTQIYRYLRTRNMCSVSNHSEFYSKTSTIKFILAADFFKSHLGLHETSYV